MTDKKTGALKLALEALERVNNTTLALKAMVPECREFAAIAQDLDCVIPAIREALAEQPAQQRPQNCGTGYCSCIECLFEPKHQEPVAYAVYHRMGGSKSLHWPEQHSEDGDHNEYQLVPLYTSPPAQQQEPVAWRTKNATPPGGYVVFQQYPQALADLGVEIEPLYTSPPASKSWAGLTNQELIDLTAIYSGAPLYCAIEAKLREKNA